MFSAIKQVIIQLCAILVQAINGTAHFVTAYSDVGEMAKDFTTGTKAELKLEQAASIRDLAASLNLNEDGSPKQ
jgi:hypothetical protein